MTARLFRRYLATPLGTRMAVASGLGVCAGWLLGDRVLWLEPLGALLVQALGLMAPLLVLLLVPGALAAAGKAPLRGVAPRVLSGFLLAACAATGIGLSAGVVLGPARPAGPWPDVAPSPPAWSGLWSGWWVPGAWTVERLVPAAFVLALVAALALRLRPGLRNAARPLSGQLAALGQRGVSLLLQGSPPCLFALAAVATARMGPALAATGAQGLFAVCAAHAALGLLLLAVPQVLPGARGFLGGCQDALWTALATGSSAATLPVELRAVERGLGVPARLARVLVPLGVAVSKAGTTAFLATLVVVAGRAAGVELTSAWLCRAALLVLAAGVLTPPMAGGGILMLGLLFGALDLPVELASVLGAVPSIGRLNTPLNALGRMVVARLAVPGAADAVALRALPPRTVAQSMETHR